MKDHKVVTGEEWNKARKTHLAKEKEFTHLRDELSADRRTLPWVKIEKDYVFDGPNGRVSLAGLFEGRDQLFIYHFMWRWDLDAGCPSCSFVMDNVKGALVHLENHGVKFVAISHGPFEKIDAFRKRLGWDADMVSSYESDFNYDFKVSFTDEQVESGEKLYNYGTLKPDYKEMPGASIFYKNEAGEIFHTYSTYTRGLDILLNTYHMLDMTPKGRNEDEIMAWLHYNDEYPGGTHESEAKEGCCH